MNKLQLIIVLLTSIITIGQKNNFYGESGKQFYKLKIDKATYDLLTIQDGTVFFNNGIQECIELTFEDGTKLVCTDDHKILTSS